MLCLVTVTACSYNHGPLSNESVEQRSGVYSLDFLLTDEQCCDSWLRTSMHSHRSLIWAGLRLYSTPLQHASSHVH